MAKRCGATLREDRDGWPFVKCDCGWKSPPCPDTEVAMDFYGDHRACGATKVAADAIRKALHVVEPPVPVEAKP